MDIRAFKYVNAIVKYGSFSEAAESLYISQPALSQYINNLEKQLGKKLFLRESRKLELTAAGRLFLHEGSKILSIYEHLEHMLEDVDEADRVIIRLGISQFYGKFYLPEILARFIKEHSNVKFSITEALTSELEEMLAAEKLDICLFPIYRIDDRLQYRILNHEEILLAVPADSPINDLAVVDGSVKKLDLCALKKEQFLMLSSKQGFYDMGTAICRKNGFEPHIICEVLNWDTLNLLVAQGLGVGFVPEVIVGINNAAVSPNYYHIDMGQPVTRAFSIVTNKQQLVFPELQEFIDFVVELAEEKIIPMAASSSTLEPLI